MIDNLFRFNDNYINRSNAPDRVRRGHGGDPFDGIKNAVISLGNFDGMHLGHMKLIDILTKRASALGAPALVYTFHEHPRNVLGGINSVKLLTDAVKKRELLCSTAVDGFYIERFDTAFASQTPETFINQVLVKKFGARLVVVGIDFRFGNRGSGDVRLLKEFGKKNGFDVEEVPPLTADAADKDSNGIISSSGIRALIASGQVERAGALLGRLFSLKCWISAYRAAGDAMDATAAVMYPDIHMAAPDPGVYITSAYAGGVLYRGFAEVNAGIGDMKSVTAVKNYFLGFHGDLHETEIEIFFYKKLDGVATAANGEFSDNQSVGYADAVGRYFNSP